MHPNWAFRGVDTVADLAVLRSCGFSVLTLAGPHGPRAIESDRQGPGGQTRRGLLVVGWPGGYVSPDCYGVED
jgi:hypothetical protein